MDYLSTDYQTEIEVDKRIELLAKEIGPELNRRLDAWLSTGPVPGTVEHTQLEGYLWDNKVGIARLLELIIETADAPKDR